MPEKLKRWLVVGMLVCVTGGLAWAIYSLLREEPQAPAQTQTETTTEFARPKLVGWSKGQRQWQVEARTMQDNGDTVALTGIERGIIFKDGKEYFTFTADHGVWKKAGESQGGGDLTLSGHIGVQKDNKQVFQTEQLIWQGASQLLVAPQPVHFTYEGNTATASRMSLNSVTEDLTLSGDVQLVLQDGMSAKIQGDVIYNMKSGTYQVKGTQEFEFNT